MQITVSKINPPRPGDPEKGWKPTKNYQIFDESGTKLLASQDKGIGSVQVGDVIEIPSASSSTMTPKDFLIVLQSSCNRDSTLTADQKLKFILDNYKAGMEATHNRLSNAEDSF